MSPASVFSQEGLNKTQMLHHIATTSSHLEASLSRAWEGVEESLWREVLTSLAEVATDAPPTTTGTSADAGGGGGGTSIDSSAALDLVAASNLWDSVNYRHHAVLCQVHAFVRMCGSSWRLCCMSPETCLCAIPCVLFLVIEMFPGPLARWGEKQ